jgi:hypothetical protein
MNRRERRAAEARRRKRARDVELVRQAPAGTVPASMGHAFFAGVAQQISMPGIGGSCVLRTLAAYQAVCAQGIDCRIGFGSLVARVGPTKSAM